MIARYVLPIIAALFTALAITLLAPSVQAAEMAVRVVVYDDTEARPLHPRAEIWARGMGSWYLAKDMMQIIQGREQGSVENLAIYPDGRESKEITVQFQLTEDLCPQSCPRDMIAVAIDDSNVTVGGFPLEAPYGDTEIVFSRE